jgi:hypothetical protein
MSGVQQQHIPAIVETIAHLIGGAIGCLIVIGGLLGVLHLGSHFGTFLAHFAPLRWLGLTLGDLLHALWLFIAMLWLALGDLLHALWLFIAMLLCMMMAAVNVLWWLGDRTIFQIMTRRGIDISPFSAVRSSPRRAHVNKRSRSRHRLRARRSCSCRRALR